MLIFVALPAIFCATRLNLDLWGDEVYTLFHFAAQPVPGIVTDYSLPNNHILYSLLIRPVFLVTTDEYLLRLPSLLISVSTLIFTFRLAWLLIGRDAAAWATWALGLNVMFQVHTMQIRGYGLSMLLIAVMANVAVPDWKDSPPARLVWWRYVGVVLLGAALLYTIPTNALFMAPLMIWGVAMTWSTHALRSEVVKYVLAWLAAWLCGLALYLPILRQLTAHHSPASTISVIHASREYVVAANHDLWPLWLLLPPALIIWRRRTRALPWPTRWATPFLCLLMFGFPLFACVVLRTAPFSRNFCPALPFLGLGIAWTMHQLLGPGVPLGRWMRSSAARQWAGCLALLALLLPPLLLYPSRLERVRRQRFAQDGYYNYYAARFEPSCVALLLRECVHPDETYAICWADRDHYDLAWQFSRVGFPLPPRHVRTGMPSGALFVVLPALPDYVDLERSCGLTRETLASFVPLGECGYFRVLQSPAPQVLASCAPQAPWRRGLSP